MTIWQEAGDGEATENTEDAADEAGRLANTGSVFVTGGKGCPT